MFRREVFSTEARPIGIAMHWFLPDTRHLAPDLYIYLLRFSRYNRFVAPVERFCGSCDSERLYDPEGCCLRSGEPEASARFCFDHRPQAALVQRLDYSTLLSATLPMDDRMV